FPVILKGLRKSQQKDFSLFLVDDGTPLEMDIRPNLFSGFQELLGMLQLELEVMVTGVRTESDFFYNRLLGIGLNFLLLLFLLVDELAVVDNPTDRRVSIRRNLNQIQ